MALASHLQQMGLYIYLGGVHAGNTRLSRSSDTFMGQWPAMQCVAELCASSMQLWQKCVVVKEQWHVDGVLAREAVAELRA